eukprot:TRINITY_DN211_c0_g1_i3.p1 TRINITY_DN211_c0_g1~~TRINITY_DN211_c0_g1_i3.p1  ORF type:complete len:241 (+),score=38.83 TRINITY_DN211_c0_g1_i3:48-770(+)
MPRHGVEDPFADPSSSIPYHSFAVDTTNQETVLSGIRYAAQTILPDWSSLSREEIEVELMSGGTTNLAVAKVSAKIKGQESIVVIRVFGINTELLIDRIAETKVIEILGNKSRISFQIYGRFANGRVEEFMPGKALVYTDLTCQLYPYIAAKVAAVHQLDVPISKEPAFWNVVEKWLKEASGLLILLSSPSLPLGLFVGHKDFSSTLAQLCLGLWFLKRLFSSVFSFLLPLLTIFVIAMT